MKEEFWFLFFNVTLLKCIADSFYVCGQFKTLPVLLSHLSYYGRFLPEYFFKIEFIFIVF